jgi:hypothetical protein
VKNSNEFKDKKTSKNIVTDSDVETLSEVLINLSTRKEVLRSLLERKSTHNAITKILVEARAQLEANFLMNTFFPLSSDDICEKD